MEASAYTRRGIRYRSAPPAPVSVARWSACGLTESGEARCWGEDRYDEASPPAVPLTRIALGPELGCGLDEQSHVVCWGGGTSREGSDGTCKNTDRLDLTPPSGEREQLALGDSCLACALDADGRIDCWGAPSLGYEPQNELPTDAFQQISVGYDFLGGVRTDGSLLCWGNRDCPLF